MLCVDECLRVFMLNTGKYTKVLVYFVANASVTRQCHKAYIFIYHMNPFSQTKAPRRQKSFKMYLISVYSLKEKKTYSHNNKNIVQCNLNLCGIHNGWMFLRKATTSFRLFGVNSPMI